MNESAASAKPEKANKFRFVFADGESKDVATDDSLNDAIVTEFVNRKRSGKSNKFCMIFAKHDGKWVPTKVQQVVISIGCI